MFSMTDTGCGLSEDARLHLFEPFFTTKGRGRAGMGLAAVHGIVSQHHGHIYVYSERDLGATFKVYFPPAGKGASVEAEQDAAAPRGAETVLLAEDEPSVRALAEKILWRQGYRVLSAANGEEALSLAAGMLAPIHLLLSDVVMPNMNGRQLFDRLKAAGRPDVKVLFMSGYPESVIAPMGVLAPGAHFLSKPFTIETLARKVREALDDR
jgi:CheY-like chemotaxis protein